MSENGLPRVEAARFVYGDQYSVGVKPVRFLKKLEK